MLRDVVSTDEPSLDELGLKYGTDKASSGHNYLKYYEPFLAAFRHEAFNLIEIGALAGASLHMWRDFFPRAQITCLDINPEVKRFEEDRIRIEIGNAGNPKFLAEVAAKVGRARFVIDDGSHRWDHVGTAFKVLYPIVEHEGIYIFEDLHTHYESKYAGEAQVPFTRSIYDMVDLMNARGDARRLMLQMFAPHIVRAAKVTESATFIARACVLKTKPARTAPDEG